MFVLLYILLIIIFNMLLPNLLQSALSFETCVIFRFLYVAYILTEEKTFTVISFNCALSNAKIAVLALVIGNAK